LSVQVRLGDIPDLVPGPQYDQRPSYFVYAGLVFQVLNQNFLRLFERSAPVDMLYLSSEGLPSPDRKEVVFINVVLPHDVNVGYHKLGQALVTAVNGRPVKELKDVVEGLKSPKDGYQVITLDHWAGSPDNRASEIVLDAKAADAANAEILKAFGIPKDRSDDLDGGKPAEPGANGAGESGAE
jgi:hypothetical protein